MEAVIRIVQWLRKWFFRLVRKQQPERMNEVRAENEDNAEYDYEAGFDRDNNDENCLEDLLLRYVSEEDLEEHMIMCDKEKKIIKYWVEYYYRHMHDDYYQGQFLTFEGKHFEKGNKNDVYIVRRDHSANVLDDLILEYTINFQYLDLTWKQDFEWITIYIYTPFPGLNDIRVQLALGKILYVRGYFRKDLYKDTLYLYETVEDIYRYKKTDTCIIVQLKKKFEERWPRLVKSVRQPRFIENMYN